jgi:RNA polymerase sigma-70 factor (ECF subfamily)
MSAKPMSSRELALTADGAVRPAAERGLVEQCRRGNAEAFARLVALHEAMVFNLACRLLGHPEEARDAAQEVFLQVYRVLGRFEGRSTLRTWIYRIVVNHCRNRRRFWMRRQRAQALPLQELTPADEGRLSRAALPTPEELLARREEARRVQDALHRVSFAHRAVLVLREVEGLSCAEIALALDVAEGTVKSRLARARDALRAQLQAREAAR